MREITRRLGHRLARGQGVRRRVGGPVLVALAGMALMGQGDPGAERAVPKVLEAERFVLRDASGVVRATLSAAGDGAPRLALRDAAGRPRAVLDLGRDGLPGLTLLAADGQTPRAALEVGADGAPGLTLFGADGTPRTIAGLYRRHGSPAAGAEDREESPALALYDAEGRARAALSLLAGGAVGLELSGPDGKLRAQLGVRADGTPELELTHEQGRARAAVSVLADGTPTLNLYDVNGTARATLSVIVNGPAGLALADRDGTVVWTSPPPPTGAPTVAQPPPQRVAGPESSTVTPPPTPRPPLPLELTREPVAALASASGAEPEPEGPRAAPPPALLPTPPGADARLVSSRPPPRAAARRDAPPDPASLAARPSATAEGPRRIHRVGLVEVGEEARVSVEADGRLTYRAFTLGDPPRLVLDFDHALHGLDRTPVPAGGTALARIRSSQFRVTPTRVVRIVLDLKRSTPYWVEPRAQAVVVHIGTSSPSGSTR